jgi:hypothetical protein
MAVVLAVVLAVDLAIVLGAGFAVVACLLIVLSKAVVRFGK